MQTIIWEEITTTEQFDSIIERSFQLPQVIYKHSTRCGTSFIVKEMLDDSSAPENANFHILDLIAHREISNLIASSMHVTHASPQILVIKNGKCIFHKSHMSINMRSIQQVIIEESNN